MQSLLWPHAVTFYMGQADQGDEYASVKAFADYCLARDVEAVQPYEMTQRWSHYRRFKTIQQRRERMNRQINERLRTLMAAYKTLGGSFTGDLVVDRRDGADWFAPLYGARGLGLGVVHA